MVSWDFAFLSLCFGFVVVAVSKWFSGWFEVGFFLVVVTGLVVRLGCSLSGALRGFWFDSGLGRMVGLVGMLYEAFLVWFGLRFGVGCVVQVCCAWLGFGCLLACVACLILWFYCIVGMVAFGIRLWWWFMALWLLVCVDGLGWLYVVVLGVFVAGTAIWCC